MGIRVFQDSQEFNNIDFTVAKLPLGDYEDCVFTACTFTNCYLNGSNFGDCEFVDCDLSMVNLSGVTLRDIRFERCKVLGVKFESCNKLLFTVAFKQCQLDFSTFHMLPLVKTEFTECRLLEVDFTDADLKGAVFHHCDLSGAIFIQSNLEKSDFGTAENYSIDPELNRMKKAKFSRAGVDGLLDKYDLELD
jgi:fluoroquinolone resistance protein